MTHEEGLTYALEALHKIAMGAYAQRRIEMGEVPTNTVLAAGARNRAMGLHEIERMAIDVWETVVVGVEPKLPGTTFFECKASDMDPGLQSGPADPEKR